MAQAGWGSLQGAREGPVIQPRIELTGRVSGAVVERLHVAAGGRLRMAAQTPGLSKCFVFLSDIDGKWVRTKLCTQVCTHRKGHSAHPTTSPGILCRALC